MDALHSLIFYVLAAVVVASAAFTAFSSHLVHAGFSLLFTFFGVACLYIQLGADFVGVSQVLIYV
ncbi:MAG: NADH-quinone oxidoreductase subunit J family protein, partial [Candidatus Hinthialibacter sp.]